MRKTYLRLHAAADDEFDIFVSNDGDTVWNGKETEDDQQADPEYVHEILQKMQTEAQQQDSDEEDMEDDREDEEALPLQDAMFAPMVRLPELRTHKEHQNRNMYFLW